MQQMYGFSYASGTRAYFAMTDHNQRTNNLRRNLKFHKSFAKYNYRAIQSPQFNSPNNSHPRFIEEVKHEFA